MESFFQTIQYIQKHSQKSLKPKMKSIISLQSEGYTDLNLLPLPC